MFTTRYVVFDNGTRLLITISFDLDFDPYFDDAIMSLVHGDKSQIRHWIQHLEETPEGGYEAMSWEEFKNFLVAAQTEADIFITPTTRRCKRSARRCGCSRRSNTCSTTPRPPRRSSTPR